MDNILLAFIENKGHYIQNIKNSKTYMFIICSIIGVDQFLMIL